MQARFGRTLSSYYNPQNFRRSKGSLFTTRHLTLDRFPATEPVLLGILVYLPLLESTITVNLRRAV